MLRESVTYVVARHETWQGACATEPVEAGWATEAVFFVRALEKPAGGLANVRVQISADGMRWADEGTEAALPAEKDSLEVLRVSHFGNWLRLAADMPGDAKCVVLVSVHLK